jgi:Family of unknown function (DUF5519)
MADADNDLARRLASLPGVEQSASMFGHDLGFWVNGKEVAHFESTGVIEVRLTEQRIREHRPAFRADRRVVLRPSGADWITVRFAEADWDFVVELVAEAEAAHRPPPGVPPTPAPSGADLERRARFHRS